MQHPGLQGPQTRCPDDEKMGKQQAESWTVGELAKTCSRIVAWNRSGRVLPVLTSVVATSTKMLGQSNLRPKLVDVALRRRLGID